MSKGYSALHDSRNVELLYDEFYDNAEVFRSFAWGKEYFDVALRSYKPYQQGRATSENFMEETVAIFREQQKRPTKAPDYVSYDRYGNISSEYWYTPKGLIRGSGHWGTGIRTVDWALSTTDGNFIGGNSGMKPVNTGKKYGFVKWGDIVRKPVGLTYDSHIGGAKRLLTFKNNPRRGEFVSQEGKKYRYNAGKERWEEDR